MFYEKLLNISLKSHFLHLDVTTTIIIYKIFTYQFLLFTYMYRTFIAISNTVATLLVSLDTSQSICGMTLTNGQSCHYKAQGLEIPLLLHFRASATFIDKQGNATERKSVFSLGTFFLSLVTFKTQIADISEQKRN